MARRHYHGAWALSGLLAVSGVAWSQEPALSALPATALTPVPLSAAPQTVTPVGAETPSNAAPTVDLNVGKLPPSNAMAAPPIVTAPITAPIGHPTAGPIAPTWRWYGWGTVNTGLPVAAPMTSTAPPPPAEPKAAPTPPATAAMPTPTSPATWTVPAETTPPIEAPALEMRLENAPPAPVPAPALPASDPFVPVQGAKLATPRGTIARASAAK